MEARFKHCASREEWWEYADALEKQGVTDFFRVTCQPCKDSVLDYSTSPPSFYCKRFNLRVGEFDSCKYGDDREFINGLVNHITNDTNNSNKTNDNMSSSEQQGGCYIATAVYGSYDCPEVWTLRRLRDEVLANCFLGRLFIKIYYTISPYAVKIFGKNKMFQTFWRRNLNKLISHLNAKGISSRPYKDK